MKKDINLLEGLNESAKKKNSSSSSLLMVVVVIILVGVMAFMFMSTKNEVEEKEEIIAGLENQINNGAMIGQMQEKYEKEKAHYIAQVHAVLSSLHSGENPQAVRKVSENIFTIIYDNYLKETNLGYDANGNMISRVLIKSIQINEGAVSIQCAVGRREDAYDFVNYMNGTLTQLAPVDRSKYPMAKVITEEDEASFVELARKNRDYFFGVMDSYAGLPAPQNGDYSIAMTLQFGVNWRGIA